ncbi:recombinase family protein [Paenibacillus hunanensis]|uniref:Site-specific DNA recombinase n=1 Tax=Paenibacillus hunanensis TaxID=539262 RepID=A0ABU1IVZ1_9BACL|nr:recombinase family protein [Paenibacillus hunanensis]MDR6243434.1 site-specific DNA recombinase [Paenibacillus hunanensis]GGI97684.1 putative integrase; bacteriophage 370.1 [Paenibacillus hunanensis]
MRVAIYIRVSTDMQAEDGFSVEGQRSRLISYAESQDWTITDFYIDDGYSAKDLKRPAMQQMLYEVKEQKFDVVLVYKLDRLTRSVANLHELLEEFDANNVKFKSATEIFETTTAMGRFFITLVGAMAEWERGTISERVRFGVEQMVKEGKRPGGIFPFGYTSTGEFIPEEAALIREAAQLYMSGLGYKSVAMRLNSLGKLRRGKLWTDATVSYTLENPFYAGIIRVGTKDKNGKYVNSNRGERVKCIYGSGDHQEIFTKEEYNAIQKYKKSKTSGGFSPNSIYWFSGALRCGRCGAAMFGKLTTQRKTTGGMKRTQYYICSSRHHSRSCDLPIFRQVHVEKLMMDYILKVKVDVAQLRDETSKIESEAKEYNDDIAEAKRELAKLAERRSRWQYMFVEGLISQDDVRRKLKAENDAEMLIRDKLAMTQKSLSGIPKVEELAQLEELWSLLDDHEKKEMILTLFHRIEINTPLTKPKGVKNSFFDAYLQNVTFN